MPTSLALLGCSPETLHLIREVAGDDRFAIAAWCEVDEYEPLLRELAPHAQHVDDWEQLGSGDLADALIVAPPGIDQTERRQQQLRQLAQVEMPMLLVQPACEGIFALELDMIRSDTGCPLLAYSPGEHHPAMIRLGEIVAAGEDSPLGEIEQILFERSLRDRSRRSVLAHLARDAAILRNVAGAASNVSAAGASSDGASLGGLSVSMNCGRGTLAVGDEREGAKLILVGARGKAALEMPAHGRWQLKFTSGDETTEESYAPDSPRGALDDLLLALESPEAGINWPEACCDLEFVASVEESLRRGRTIPIYEQRASEEQTFKGLMSVGSCAVILVLFAFALVWAVVEGIRLAQLTRDQPVAGQPQDDRGQDRAEPERWPLLVRMWPVYPLAVFLLLQLFRLVFRKPHSPPELSDGSRKSKRGTSLPP
jgi:hypothetical protein